VKEEVRESTGAVMADEAVEQYGEWLAPATLRE